MGSRSVSDESADATLGMGLKGLGKAGGFFAGVGGGSTELALLRRGWRDGMSEGVPALEVVAAAAAATAAAFALVVLAGGTADADLELLAICCHLKLYSTLRWVARDRGPRTRSGSWLNYY